jgi:hypothetical protein
MLQQTCFGVAPGINFAIATQSFSSALEFTNFVELRSDFRTNSRAISTI